MTSLSTWGTHDDAEYNRLAAEMNEDMKLQFKLFTFAITATTAVLGFLTSRTAGADSTLFSGLPLGTLFLTPLVLLLPTSLMVLNRARTRNRKAAYVVVALDYKRLRGEGVTDQTPLKEVRRLPVIPWETALHILDRTNRNENRRVHLAPSLKYMSISYFVIEILCVALAFYTSRQVGGSMLIYLALIVACLVFPVYGYRIRVLIGLKDEISVQGYVDNWLRYKFQESQDRPQYLREWIDEYRHRERRIPNA